MFKFRREYLIAGDIDSLILSPGNRLYCESPRQYGQESSAPYTKIVEGSFDENLLAGASRCTLLYLIEKRLGLDPLQLVLRIGSRTVVRH